MSILRRTFCFLLVAALLLVTAHRLPAPIQEVQESPTPATEQKAKPKKTQSRPKAVEPEPKTRSVPKPTATPTGPKFAGTWTGAIESKNPLVGVGFHPATFVVNPAENSIKETGPVGTFAHAAMVNGNTLSFKTGVFSEIIVTMKLIGDGRTGQVNVNDKFWGTCSGTMKKQD